MRQFFDETSVLHRHMPSPPSEFSRSTRILRTHCPSGQRVINIERVFRAGRATTIPLNIVNNHDGHHPACVVVPFTVAGAPTPVLVRNTIRHPPFPYHCSNRRKPCPGFGLQNQRTKRPPGNEVNALISFGNSLLYATTLTEIYKTHLNPTISYLHQPRERRFSLSLDISEVFKPVIVDRVIFSLVNRQRIQIDDFRDEMEGCLLAEDSRKEFVRGYEERLEKTVDHPTLDKKVSHQRLLRLEGYKLVKHVSDDDTYKGYRMPDRA